LRSEEGQQRKIADLQSQLTAQTAELSKTRRLLEQRGKNKEKLEEATDQTNCIVCMERPRTVLLLPCSHLVACQECWKKMEQWRCSVCRSEVESCHSAKLM
jgi:hypothetical protein